MNGSPGLPVRVLHWNVHGWVDPATGRSNLASVEDLISRTAPHVVSLVEVDERYAEPTLLSSVAEACECVPVFVPAFFYGNPERPSGSFGNAILTKLPVLAVTLQQLTWPDTIYDGTEPSEPRALLLVRVATASGPMWVGSIHLPRGEAAARAGALGWLADITGALEGPWLVCGDFNIPPAEWPGGPATSSLAPTTPTYPADAPNSIIDYAIGSSGLQAETRTLRQPGSDHLPVLTSIPILLHA